MQQQKKQQVCDLVPKFSSTDIPTIILQNYNLKAHNIKHLYGYDTLNIKFEAQFNSIQQKFLMKISYHDQSQTNLNLQNQTLLQLNQQQDIPFKFPKPIPSRHDNNQFITQAKSSETNLIHKVRVLTFVDGQTMQQFPSKISQQVAFKMGQACGICSKAINKIKFDEIKSIEWDLSQFSHYIQKPLQQLKQSQLKQKICNCSQLFNQNVTKHLSEYPQALIHGDLNPANILYDKDLFDNSGQLRISGFIDFQDSIQSLRINDFAIACAYMLWNTQDKKQFNGVLRNFIKGWKSKHPMEEKEMMLLRYLIPGRAAFSITYGLVKTQNSPDEIDDEYIGIHRQCMKRILYWFDEMQDDQFLGLIKDD